MELHKQIKELRIAAGITQQKLADDCGITQSTVARFETGRTPEYTIKTLRLFAGYLGKEVSLTDAKL